MRFHYLLLLSVALVGVVVGGVLLSAHVRLRRDKLAWDSLYRDAREYYRQAAELKDGDASQFDPKYVKATEAANALETFINQNPLAEPDSKTAFAASSKLTLCVSTLQAYRFPIPDNLNAQSFKLRLIREIDNCVADGRIGSPDDMK